MAKTSSRNYKNYTRNQRILTNEPMFTGGMHYNENPLREGSAKLLVNMIQKDYGQRVRPRGGWRKLSEPWGMGTAKFKPYVHHTGSAFVEDVQTGSVTLMRYALVLSRTYSPDWAELEWGTVYLEDPTSEGPLGAIRVASFDSTKENFRIKHDNHSNIKEIQGMSLQEQTPTGIHASIEGNTYLLTPQGLGRLHIYRTSGLNFSFEVKLVTPLSLTPTQAVNYGYNLLLENPYNFPNTEGPNFRPEGILPYDTSTGKIKLQARVGERVRFKLVYQYQTNKTYKVQWEVQDITRQDGVIVVQKKENSPTFSEGAEVFVDYQSPFKQFSVIATIYDSTDMTTPLRVMMLASYHLSDDDTPTRQEERNYDLMTSKGVTTWKNQMVYWGANGAEMSVFISDTNDPTYVPFPHHALLYDSKVLKAFTHLDSLIVMTETGVHQVDFAMDAGYTSRPVQTNMQLRESDTPAMYSVRNLVCFKSANYYYMIVPNIKNDRGELQIAPISEAVHQLLDNFEEEIKQIITDVFTLRQLFNVPASDISMNLADYKSFPEGNRLRHVYKIKLEVQTDVYYLDVHLIYDTIFRSWTIEIIEANKTAMKVFQSSATNYAQFLNIGVEANEYGDDEAAIQWIGIDEHNPEDDFTLYHNQPRTFFNYQLLDTGKRDIEGTKKKRMRHVVLEVNNLSGEELEFNHLLYLDDEQREDLFKYSVIHITDPEDPNYGQIYVEREYVDPTLVHGTTKLDTWKLEQSKFPDQTIVKVHLTVSGKGYYPRLRLLTRTTKLYELNQITWAYREMNAR